MHMASHAARLRWLLFGDAPIKACITLGLKYGAGDVIVQKASSPTGEIDKPRACIFWAFGTYYGFVNYTCFRLLAWSPWPRLPWPKAAFSAFVDGCVHVPIVLYPQLYFVSELVMSGETRTLREHFDVGMSKYYTNVLGDIAASAGVFIPVGVVNFRYVPLAWRTPFCAAFGLLFPILVSWQRGSQIAHSNKEKPKASDTE